MGSCRICFQLKDLHFASEKVWFTEKAVSFLKYIPLLISLQQPVTSSRQGWSIQGSKTTSSSLQEVVDRIQGLPKDENDKPRDRVTILDSSSQPVAQPYLTPLEGVAIPGKRSTYDDYSQASFQSSYSPEEKNTQDYSQAEANNFSPSAENMQGYSQASQADANNFSPSVENSQDYSQASQAEATNYSPEEKNTQDFSQAEATNFSPSAENTQDFNQAEATNYSPAAENNQDFNQQGANNYQGSW